MAVYCASLCATHRAISGRAGRPEEKTVHHLLARRPEWTVLLQPLLEFRLRFPRVIDEAPIDLDVLTIYREENADAFRGLGVVLRAACEILEPVDAQSFCFRAGRGHFGIKRCEHEAAIGSGEGGPEGLNKLSL